MKAKARTELAESRIRQAEARAEAAEIRTEKAESRTEFAKTRTELAEIRTEQAEIRTEHAKTRAEQAEIRAEQAELSARDAETRAQQAEVRAHQAEAVLKSLIESGACNPSLGDASALANGQSSGLDRLTPRQREVLKLIARGKNTKQIAYRLKLSPKTIEYHRAKLMHNLKIHDIPTLVRFALRVGLVPPEI